MPEVAAVKTTPVLIALKSRTVWRKTETTNVIPMSSSHWVFWVTEPEIGGAIAEQAGGEQRLLARSLVGPDVQEEPEHEARSERQKDDQQRVVVAGLQDPEDHERHVWVCSSASSRSRARRRLLSHAAGGGGHPARPAAAAAPAPRLPGRRADHQHPRRSGHRLRAEWNRARHQRVKRSELARRSRRGRPRHPARRCPRHARRPALSRTSAPTFAKALVRSEEHTSELQSR